MEKRECTDGEWSCEMSTHLAALESENVRLENENVLLKSVIDKCNKARTTKQIRNHHKARIIQARNNIQSLIEDEKSILADEERVQLSRIICKMQNVLIKWHIRNMDMQYGGIL